MTQSEVLQLLEQIYPCCMDQETIAVNLNIRYERVREALHRLHKGNFVKYDTVKPQLGGYHRLKRFYSSIKED